MENLIKRLMGPSYVSTCMLLRATDVFFRKTSLSLFPPLILIMLEHFIGSIILLPRIHKLKIIKTLSAKDIFSLLFIACGTSVGGILFFTSAFNYMNPAIVILLQKLQPVVTILLSFLILKDVPKWFFWPILPVVVVAGYIMSFGLNSPLTSINGLELKGTMYALLAVFFWGAGAVFGKRLLKSMNYMDLATIRYIGGFIFTLILFPTIYDKFKIVPLTNYLPIVYMALVPGLLALILYYKGLKTVSATLSSILELLFPLSSAVIVWVFLGIKMNSVQIASATVLLISITVLTLLKPTKS